MKRPTRGEARRIAVNVARLRERRSPSKAGHRSMAGRWPAKLSRPILMRHGTKLETLAEAGSFILALPEAFQHRNSWMKATELLIAAGDHDGNIEAATEAVERAATLEQAKADFQVA